MTLGLREVSLAPDARLTRGMYRRARGLAVQLVFLTATQRPFGATSRLGSCRALGDVVVVDAETFAERLSPRGADFDGWSGSVRDGHELDWLRLALREQARA